MDIKRSLEYKFPEISKEWHPDKFQQGDAQQAEAEIQSRKIIDGYHFLVSIAPETKAANLPEYTAAMESGIADYHHKGLVLEMTYLDGPTYEFFGVTKPIYLKMIQSNKLNRFAKRSIYPNYLYRKSKRTQEQE